MGFLNNTTVTVDAILTKKGRELLAQGKANLHAPWLGLTGFFVIGLILTLLIFIGEAVRDAFDPRKTIS